MTGTSPIDLSRIASPDVIETLDYEEIFNDMRDALVALDPNLADDLALESSPINKVLQIVAYKELSLRQRINESARAVMLAHAEGADLDNLAARFEVQRLVLVPGNPDANPPTDPVYESNDDLRLRVQLALDGLSTAGPERAYIYHALSADGNILDASVDTPRFSLAEISAALQAQLPTNAIVLKVDYDAGLSKPMPGDVVTTVLSREGSGTPSQPILNAVKNALSAEDVRPLTDHVIVQPATIKLFNLHATLYTFDGPDVSVVINSAKHAVQTYLSENKRLGRSITRSGIYASLHTAGVQRVELSQPLTDIDCSIFEVAHPNQLHILHGGTA